MINTMLTTGYSYLAILTLFLYIAIKNNVKFAFLPLDDKNIAPALSTNIERVLAVALGVTIFVCGMLAFSSLFPTMSFDMTDVLP